MEAKNLSRLFTSTLFAFTKRGEVDDELLAYSTKALELAFTLIPAQEIAFQIALDAALNVKQMAYQRERYKRYSRAEKTTKVLLKKLQLFQQMIWYESQKWEKYQETDYLLRYLRCREPKNPDEFEAINDLRPEELEENLRLSEIESLPHLAELKECLESTTFVEKDLLVRYLKFLMQYSLDNNSSYVAFIVSHMIYDYTLPEVIDICASLNPDSIGGQYLYKLKPKFIEKIKERFNIFINYRGKGVNEHFEIEEDVNGQLVDFVKELCHMLTPWKTECMAEYQNKKAGSFDEILFDWLERISDENQKEILRAHVAICPKCYSRLVAECRIKGRSTGRAEELHPPGLAIPRFRIPKRNVYSKKREIVADDWQREPTEMAKRIRESVFDESARTLQAPSSFKKLIIFADGEKRAEFNPTEKNSIRFNLDEDARLIKVVSLNDRESHLLATLILNRNEVESSLSHRLFGWGKTYFTDLSDGWEIRFSIDLTRTSADDTNFIIEISCQKSSAASVLQHAIKPLLEMLKPPFLFSPIRAFVAAAVVVSIFLALYFALLNKQPTRVDLVKRGEQKQDLPLESKQQPDSPKLETGEARPAPTGTTIVESKQRQKRPGQFKRDDERADDRTMVASEQSDTKLSSVQRIYIDPFGDSPSEQELYRLLTTNLTKEKFEIQEERSLAEAVLQGSLKEDNDSQVVDVELVNERGKVLFKKRFTANKDLADVAARISHSLFEERENHKDTKETKKK